MDEKGQVILPGRAIKASASRAIAALRSCMSETVLTSPTVSPDICPGLCTNGQSISNLQQPRDKYIHYN